MSTSFHCPICGGELAGAGSPREGAFCMICGVIVEPRAPEWNPYAAPSADLADRGEEARQAWAIPRSLVGKLALTLGLLGANLPLFGGIVLTAWLPANLLIEVLLDAVPAGGLESATNPINALFTAILDPLVAGALTFAAARRLDGHRVRYGEAMAVGLANWGRLFVAELAAGLRIFVGFLALVVPGVILTVRYSLLGPAVVLERSADPRGRSTHLTRGQGWAIFLTLILANVLHTLVSWATNEAVAQFEPLDSLAGAVALDCLVSLAGSAGTIAMVVFYVAARRAEDAAEPGATTPPGIEAKTPLNSSGVDFG